MTFSLGEGRCTILDYKCAFVQFLIQFISCEEEEDDDSHQNHGIITQSHNSRGNHPLHTKRRGRWGTPQPESSSSSSPIEKKKKRNMTCSVPDWFSDPLQRGMAPSSRALLTHIFFLWIIDRDNSRSGRGRYSGVPFPFYLTIIIRREEDTVGSVISFLNNFSFVWKYSYELTEKVDNENSHFRIWHVLIQQGHRALPYLARYRWRGHFNYYGMRSSSTGSLPMVVVVVVVVRPSSNKVRAQGRHCRSTLAEPYSSVSNRKGK